MITPGLSSFSDTNMRCLKSKVPGVFYLYPSFTSRPPLYLLWVVSRVVSINDDFHIVYNCLFDKT